MKGLYLVKILNRFSIIYAVLSFLIANVENIDLGTMAFMWQVLIVFIVFNFKGKKAFYPIGLLVFLPLIMIKSSSLFIIVVLTGVYGIYYALKGLGELDYDYSIEEFERGSFVLLVLFGLALIFINIGVLGKASGYYIILFMVSSIVLLRSLRNIDYIRNNEKIRKINLINTTIIVGASCALSVSTIRNAIIGFIKGAYIFVTDTVLYVFSWFFLGLGIVIEKIFRFIMSRGSGLKNPPEIKSGQGMRPEGLDKKSLIEGLLEIGWLNTLLRIILIILIIVLIIKVFKGIRGSRHRVEDEFEETKEFIGGDGFALNNFIKKAAAFIKPLSNYEKIRHYYKRFLKMAVDNGIRIEKRDTTFDITQKTIRRYDEESLNKMRNTYIKVRYGNHFPNRDDVKRFIMYFRNIK